MSSVETLSKQGQKNSSLIIHNKLLVAILVMRIELLWPRLESVYSLNERVQKIRENVLAVLW